jgi:hypothetical protein
MTLCSITEIIPFKVHLWVMNYPTKETVPKLINLVMGLKIEIRNGDGKWKGKGKPFGTIL